MKRIITGLLLVAVLVAVASCASSEQAAPEPSVIPAPAPAPAPMPPTESEGSFFGGSDDSAGKGTTVTVPGAPAPPMEIDEETSISDDRLIVRNGNISLVVEDVADTIARITELTDSFGGFVVSSNSWREGERMMGSISIRVPVESFDGAIGALRGMAVEVNSESTSGKDVTEEYVDLGAQLVTLEATEVQLLELMERTGEVKDILEVQRELTNVQREIEQLKARRQYLENTAAMSLINISLQQSKLSVEFNATQRTAKAGEDIRFYPTFAGGFPPYSYEWDFGDGETSTAESPRHTYKEEGIYTVTLKATDDKGYEDEATREDYIEVLPGWNAGSIASSAWSGLSSFGRGLASFFIWLGIFSPVWIIIGVILYFAWWRRRKRA